MKMLKWILSAFLCFGAIAAHGVVTPCFPQIEQASTHFYASATKAWQINSHNTHKINDFKRLFAKYRQTFSYTQIDLDEIDADPISVAAHKASQLGEYVLVEDTSLDIEGADIGVNLRWKKDQISAYAGKKATWRVLIGYRVKDLVYIYKGEIQGTIVPPRGKQGYGFESVFQPDGERKTLAENSNDALNARALAVDAFMKNNYHTIIKAIYDWDGAWQHD